MTTLTKTLRRIAVGFLCLLMLTSLISLDTKDVHAMYVIKEIEITSDRPLHQGTDIAAFLKGIHLVQPEAVYVKTFRVNLYKDLGGENLVLLTSGKADAGAHYIALSVDLIREDGTQHTVFCDYKELAVTFNGIKADVYDVMGPGYQITASAGLRFTAKPRFVVTFNADGGKPVPDKQYVLDGGKVKEPKEPAKKGYEFLGWWHDVPKFSEKWDFNTPLHQDLPLIARWKALSTAPPTTTAPTTTKTTTTETTTLETTPTETTTHETTTPETTASETTTPTETLPDLTSTSPTVIDETTQPPDKGEKDKGFDYMILLYIIGGVILLIALAIITYLIVRKKK
ncbi:MAG TPA: InlB B-repeat-containing protein [Bacillota bacterium]|nr:InlB B-repeat-containing protein [Bacillota bacterium]